MHTLNPIPENEKHDIFYDHEIKTEHLFLAIRPDIVFIYKNNKKDNLMDFFVPGEHWMKIKEKRKWHK